MNPIFESLSTRLPTKVFFGVHATTVHVLLQQANAGADTRLQTHGPYKRRIRRTINTLIIALHVNQNQFLLGTNSS